jgi:uracil phosphoribosyltransferase
MFWNNTDTHAEGSRTATPAIPPSVFALSVGDPLLFLRAQLGGFCCGSTKASRTATRCDIGESVNVITPAHPLIGHKLTQLRDQTTDSATFRRLANQLITLLAYESTKRLSVEPRTIQTPVAPMTGSTLCAPAPVVVPVLRAGLGLLDGLLQILPEAEVGFLGVARNEDTLLPTVYLERISKVLTGRPVFVLDPMLATGGTLIAATRILLERGAEEITCISLLASPEGIHAMEQAFKGHKSDESHENHGGHGKRVTLVTAAIDQGINEKGYIVPGLGDAGDRLYATV